MSDELAMFETIFERRLRAYAGAGAPQIGQTAVARAVAAGVANADRPRWPTLKWTTLAPAALVVAVAGALAIGLWINGDRGVGPGGTTMPGASPTVQPTDSIAPAASPSFAVHAGAEMAWSEVDASGLGLSTYPWRDPSHSRVLWINDRFVLADEGLRTVLTSPDGVTWGVQREGSPDLNYYEAMVADSVATWHDEVVGWDSGRRTLTVARPSNETLEHEFEGIVETATIGPEGIVVRTHSALNFDAYITSLMGAGWVEHMTDFQFTDGVLRITTDDDRDLELVWADSGYEPGDVADRGFGWLSPDGDGWTQLLDFPDNVSELVATSDGFLARGRLMWSSADSLRWHEIGPYQQGSVVPWLDGAMLVPNGAADFEKFQFWNADGLRPVANAPTIAATWTSTGVGPLGLVALTGDSIVYSFDATEWRTSPMPQQMATDANGPAATIAVGSQTVVALVWQQEPEGLRTPSLWIGTFNP